MDHLSSSHRILLTLVAAALLVGLLYEVGLLGAALRGFGAVVRGSVRGGFRVWQRLFAWAPWYVFLTSVLGLIGLGWVESGTLPALTVACGLAALFMGVVACLAYMFIDVERYEVERGYKAVHNPVKGQELAVNLARYGPRVGVPLLAAAAVGAIGGFALLNQGLYATVGRDWYRMGEEKEAPAYADFLAYSVINLYRVVDLLDVANSYKYVHLTYVRPARWPARTVLVLFQTFFTLVLLQQIFASIRQGTLLAETITDFWSPHEPIHERARSALPQHGVNAVAPLLASMRAVPALTKEQRDALPPLLADIGPGGIPALAEHLTDPHEHVRAVSAAALGRLHALDALPRLAGLAKDPSDLVRQSAVEALGVLGGPGVQTSRRRRRFGRRGPAVGRWRDWVFRRRGRAADTSEPDPVEQIVATLREALHDESASVRLRAVESLGLVGPAARAAVPDLISLFEDADETVRGRAAEALGKVGKGEEAAVAALTELLADASAAVKDAAAQALGALKGEAADAVPALVPLLQDREESVRQAAAEAIGQIGTLSGAAAAGIVNGLSSPDNVVRAQTAEALGTIGAPAEEAAPALVEALADDHGQVRAKAAEALGKIGETAADVAVPSLVRALRDKDSSVSALAAEALGEMGESADEAVPALVRSLRHVNAQVRANAAEALGKLGEAAADAGPALVEAAEDADGGARAHAVRALGAVGDPTPAAAQVIRAALGDADPLVRAAAVEAFGQSGGAAAEELLPLLEDANDQVKLQAVRVLPRLAGATPAVVDGLARRLLEDDSAWVQANAALALGQLGPAAAAAGPALLRAARTAEVTVREQAVRAVAMIQPPETAAALEAGLQDSNPEIRKAASGGWMKAKEVPEQVVPALVAALRDPEPQVRANAAHALARLEELPGEAVPLLIECAADPRDGLRMNAALALKAAPAGAAADVMRHLLEDPNPRVRLVAASALLEEDADHAQAAEVVVGVLGDATPRIRAVALELVQSLGVRGTEFLEKLRQRADAEDEPEVRARLAEVLAELERAAGGA